MDAAERITYFSRKKKKNKKKKVFYLLHIEEYNRYVLLTYPYEVKIIGIFLYIRLYRNCR